MKVGGTRLLGIPSDLAYGAQGYPPDIAPDETLWFVVEVKDVQADRRVATHRRIVSGSGHAVRVDPARPARRARACGSGSRPPTRASSDSPPQ